MLQLQRCSTLPSLLGETETKDQLHRRDVLPPRKRKECVDLTRLMNLRTPPLVVRILVSTPTWLYFNLIWQHTHHRLHCHHRPHLHHAYLTNFLPPLVQNY
ncbi:uncharacterized protein LOC144918880 [Branchiostoma floridae x Branchiostoma belcheri]